MGGMARSEHCFIVRLWRECGADQGDWRGSIDHIGTRERQYFAALNVLQAFIADRLGSVEEEGGRSRDRSKP